MSSIVSAIQSLGSDLSGIFGAGGNNVMAGNMASAFNPMGNAAPAALQSAFQPQGPATPTGGTQTGATPTTQPPTNMSAIGKLYLDYLMQKRLKSPSFTGGFSTPMSAAPPFNPFPQTPAAIAPPQVQL